MASTYIVQNKQNIYDVAVQLYGSVEGIFDLLITNDWLTMDTTLKAGDELQYHPQYTLNKDILGLLNERGIVVVNGDGAEVTSYYGMMPVFVLSATIGDSLTGKMTIGGTGSIFVDWGDSGSSTHRLSGTTVVAGHNYGRSDNYTIKCYADGTLNWIDLRGLSSTLYLTQNVTLEALLTDSRETIPDMSLFDLIDSVDRLMLRNQRFDSLTFVEKYDLLLLDLIGSEIDPTVMQEYLIWINNHLASLRGCDVYLDESQVNYNCYTLINEIVTSQPYGGEWCFYVGDTVINSGFTYKFNLRLS